MVDIYQNFTPLKNYFTVCLNILCVSWKCCIILSPMTESKIGHLRSRWDITLLDQIGSDWRGARGGAAVFSKTQKYGVTGHFQNIAVHQFCIKSFLFVYPSVLNASQTTGFSNCFQEPQAGGIFSFSVPLKPGWKTKKGHHAWSNSQDFLKI